MMAGGVKATLRNLASRLGASASGKGDRVRAEYLRGLPGSNPVYLSGAMPRPREASEDVRRAWVQAAGRALDLLHNNGWIAGSVAEYTAQMIGDQLRPNLKPDMSAFGWSDQKAAEWARAFERRFAIWADNPNECDAGGRFKLAQIQRAQIGQWWGTGEIVTDHPVFSRDGGKYKTKLRVIPSSRLSSKTDALRKLQHGVFLDRHGGPAGYLFNVAAPHGGMQEISQAARDGTGRVMTSHVFDGDAGTVRGITPLAPILRVARDYDELTRAGLTQHMMQSIFAAVLESDYPTREVLEGLQDEDEQDGEESGLYGNYLTQKAGAVGAVNIDLGRHGRIASLPDGAKLKFTTTGNIAGDHEKMAMLLLREIARCLGIAAEDMVGDYRGVSYTGVRIGIAKKWPLLLYRRRVIAAPPSQMALEGFMEETIMTGETELPGGVDAFRANRAALCRCDWSGPPKPVADEVKAARTHQIYRDMGVITDEQVCTDLGTDRDQVYAARAFEKSERERLKIHGGITNGGQDIDAMIAADDAAAAAELAGQDGGNG